jgi:hypothetical protein
MEHAHTEGISVRSKRLDFSNGTKLSFVPVDRARRALSETI